MLVQFLQLVKKPASDPITIMSTSSRDKLFLIKLIPSIVLILTPVSFLYIRTGGTPRPTCVYIIFISAGQLKAPSELYLFFSSIR
jgi:hypothetical protein